MNTILKSKLNNKKKGFTLIELIVVLAVAAVLLTLTIFGIFTWQSWSKFQHEDSVAEDIFFAAQNQLTQYESSGALNRKVVRPLLEASQEAGEAVDEKSGYANGYIIDSVLLGKIKYGKDPDSASSYSWSDVWQSNKNESTQPGTLLRLKTKDGDYDRYLAGTLSDEMTDVGAKILFELVASYISDTSVLNRAITLEFSPDGAMVFSASFTDEHSELYYSDETASTDNAVSVMDRTEETRRDNMVGYYSVSELAQKIKGRGDNLTDLILELSNANVLDLIVHDQATGDDALAATDSLKYVLYDGMSHEEIATFSMKVSDFPSVTNLASAAAKPTEIEVEFLGKYSARKKQTQTYRFPVYVVNGNEYHIILDAADVQAQTVSYVAAMEAMKNDDATDDDKDTFKNTYSFYRFGLDARYIYAGLEVTKNGASAGSTTSVRKFGGAYIAQDVNGDQITECTTFSDYIVVDSAKATLEIANFRHFYNVRYETDYRTAYTASGTGVSNTYKLIADLDWEDFVGKSVEGSENYFLNSFSASVASGIAYDGCSVATGIKTEQAESNGDVTYLYTVGSARTDTKDYPFPGFKSLYKQDTFTSGLSKAELEEADDAGNTVVEPMRCVSNLTITVTGNILYGIYGKDNQGNDIKELCKDDDYSGVLGLWEDKLTARNSDGSKAARGGLLPLGLFAENLGTITHLALNKHVVDGMQRVSVTKDGTTATTIVYSCMVGGFAGNNIGSVSDLILYDNEENDGTTDKADKAGVTHIKGRTDVGGIIGRESFSVTQNADVTISGLTNYGHVTGMEYVGGIVGRAYVHYVGDDSENNTPELTGNGIGNLEGVEEDQRFAYEYFHDGYSITDTFESISGEKIHRAKTVTIDNCTNWGVISGDALVYHYKIDTQIHNYVEHEGVTQGTIGTVDPYRFDITPIYYYQCACIGGIAGLTMDGFMITDSYMKWNDGQRDDAQMARLYESFLSGSFSLMTVKNCKGTMLYTEKEAEDIIKTINTDLESNMDNNLKNNKTEALLFTKDLFKGGLIGYSRLTNIKGCTAGYQDSSSIFGGNMSSYIFGYRFVGGGIGCSDITRYDAVEEEDGVTLGNGGRVYTAVNGNTVIGRYCVGGVTGACGIADRMQEGFTFRDPSLNEGSWPSQIHEYINNQTYFHLVRYALNTGCVLGIKGNRYDGVTVQNLVSNKNGTNNNYNDQNMTCGIGGIAGYLRVMMIACDNLQTDEAKTLTLKLVGLEQYDATNYADITAKEMMTCMLSDDQKFGGFNVGGLVGENNEGSNNGEINYYNNDASLKGVKSNVDAIIFGEAYVGGGIGFLRHKTFNVYPSKQSDSSQGMLVLGRYGAGGLVGRYYYKVDYNDTSSASGDPISKSYTVVGEYGVGGLVGWHENGDNKTLNIKIDMEENEKAKIKGIVYAGGLIGVDSGNVAIIGNVKGMEISAKYFAGGYIGAIERKPSWEIENKLYKDLTVNLDFEKLRISDIDVEADIFAGGYTGLYNISDGDLFMTMRDQKRSISTLMYIVENNLITTDNENVEYADATEAYKNLAVGDIDGKFEDIEWIKNYGYTNGFAVNGTLNPDTTLDLTKVELDGFTVEAKLFAGGVSGYIPVDMNLTIKNFTNRGTIKTTSTVTGSVLEKSLDQGKNYSYLGSVCGRISKGTTVVNSVSNVMKGDDYSSAATYLGGLTEVNDGTITGTENDALESATAYNYSTKEGIAAFAGVNLQNGVITYCENQGKLTASEKAAGGIAVVNSGDINHCKNTAELSAKNAAGIAVSSSASIANCENTGKLTGTADAAGIAVTCTASVESCTNSGAVTGTTNAAGIAVTSTANITSCTNSGAVTGTTNAAGIAVTSTANITDCTNSGAVTETTNAAGIAVTSTANITSCINSGAVTGTTNAAGIAVTGSKTISACSNENTVSGKYTGGIAVNNKGTIDNCTNKATLNGTIVGGIAAYADGGSTIRNSINHGCIYAADSASASGDARAAGVLCMADNSATTKLNLTYDINTGVIHVNNAVNSAYSAGIVYDSKNLGVLYACRNYGTGIKNGITTATKDTAAFSMHYCFDATNAETHLGTVKAQYDGAADGATLQQLYAAPTENMYANFDIGEKEETTTSTYFTGEMFYSKHTHLDSSGERTYFGSHSKSGVYLYTRDEAYDSADFDVSKYGCFGDASKEKNWDVSEATYEIKVNEVVSGDVASGTKTTQEATTNISDLNIVWDNTGKTWCDTIYSYWDKRTSGNYQTMYNNFKNSNYLVQAVEIVEDAGKWFIIEYGNDIKNSFIFTWSWGAYEEYKASDFANANSGNTGKELYSKFIFGVYCYMMDTYRDDATQDIYSALIAKLYPACDADEYANSNKAKTINYHLSLYSGNNNNNKCTTSQRTVIIPEGSAYYSEKIELTEQLDYVYKAAGFNTAEIHKIVIIITGTSNTDIVGIRTFQYKSSTDSDFKAMPTIDEAGVGQFEGKTMAEIAGEIVKEDSEIPETVFYSEQEDGASTYALKVYQDTATGINGLSTNPTSKAYLEDYTDYSMTNADSLTRIKVYKELDAKYKTFLTRYFSVSFN